MYSQCKSAYRDSLAARAAKYRHQREHRRGHRQNINRAVAASWRISMARRRVASRIIVNNQRWQHMAIGGASS